MAEDSGAFKTIPRNSTHFGHFCHPGLPPWQRRLICPGKRFLGHFPNIHGADL
jgi:hypothetical protein